MFRNAAQGLAFEPTDGQRVIVYAKASLYDRDGKFQLYVNTMKMDGLGDLFLAFEQLKNKLYEEGLFDTAHKRAIPYLPRRIGVVTSSSGAVIRDILHVLGRRFPDFNLVLSPTVVQGPTAARSIVDSIVELNRRDDIDVIIVARGGGSIEDLWCFNEEKVARAVYASKVPIISAVGHETDYTICDFAADLRAPTPSAAAELVMPIENECLDRIRSQTGKLTKRIESRLDYEKLKLDHLRQHRFFLHPEHLYDHKREEIDFLKETLFQNFNRTLDQNKMILDSFIHQLDGLSPLKVLQRGYAVPQNKRNSAIVRSVDEIGKGDGLIVRITDGELDCSVLSVKRNSI